MGCARLIESDHHEDRFQQVANEWQETVRAMVVPEEIPEYTGPHLFGGFSFDPLNEPSDEWRNYPAARFVVPEVMWTVYKGRAWVTLNRSVSPSGEIKERMIDEDLLRLKATHQHRQEDDTAGHIIKEEIAPTDWMEAVAKAATSIRDGELQKVVLARQIRLFAERSFRAEQILRRLLQEQDNTYVFAIEQGSDLFIGATPERLVKSKGRQFLTLSLAGSIARGQSEAEDQKLGEFLTHDLKNLHEHDLAVEMITDAMSKLCEEVQVPEGPILYKLKDIQHLLTPISGQAREGATLLQAVEMLHPTPALGGMPQKAAVEAIRSLEQMDRGWYAAPIGWLNRSLDGEFAAAIRSALIRGKEAILFAGCGIVGDSDPESEYQETALKFTPMLSALGALDKQE